MNPSWVVYPTQTQEYYGLIHFGLIPVIYRGCADHKIWPPDLALDYNGCSTQGYGRWAKKNVIWCFCDTHECNVNIEGVAAMYGGIRGRPEQRQAPARIYRDFPRQMPPRLEEITFYKPKAPPFQPIRYMPRPPQQVGPRVRYVNYNDGRQGPRFDNDVGPPQTTPPPRPRRTTPRATEEPADNQYETGTPEGKKGPKNEDDYENVLELIERLMRSPKDREFLDLGPGGNKIPPKDDLEGKGKLERPVTSLYSPSLPSPSKTLKTVNFRAIQTVHSAQIISCFLFLFLLLRILCFLFLFLLLHMHLLFLFSFLLGPVSLGPKPP